MPAPTTFRGQMAQARRLQAATRTYRASSDYAARRTFAVLNRGLQSAGTASTTSAASSFTPIPLPTICSNTGVLLGYSCSYQAANPGWKAELSARQRAATAGGYTRHNAPSGYSPSGYSPASTGMTAARSATFARNIGARLSTMRAQVQGYNRGGYPASYAPTYPGFFTAGGYQTTGADTAPAPAPPAAVDPGQAQLPAPQPPAPQQSTTPAPAADQRQALQVFQQSRTARGLPTVSGVEYLPSVDALAQQLLMTSDPDSRGALPYTLGHIYQVISEQAVRLGDLALAQVYSALSSRYPAPPAMAGFGAFQIGGVSLGGWALTLAVSFGAAVGFLAVRDGRRPSRPRRNGRRRTARR